MENIGINHKERRKEMPDEARSAEGEREKNEADDRKRWESTTSSGVNEPNCNRSGTHQPLRPQFEAHSVDSAMAIE